MIEQVVQWIALPAGGLLDEGRLRVSVAVAPRLRTDEATTLAPFSDWHDWPARIRAADFSVEVNGTTVPALVAGTPPDSGLWTALFDADTPLTPFVFDDYADRPLVSWSVVPVIGALRDIYTRVAAASPTELPPLFSRPPAEPAPAVTGLVELLEELTGVGIRGLLEGVRGPDDLRARVGARLHGAREEAARRRAPGGARGGPLIEPLPADGTLAGHLQRALVFHTRAEAQPIDLPPGAARYRDEIDFHRMLSALGDHPWLLRQLGLVIDLTVDAAHVDPASPATPGRIAVHAEWATDLPGRSRDVLPPTAYAYIPTADRLHFRAAERNPDPGTPPDAPPTGLLPLPGAAFSAEQLDADGAALKTLNFGATLHAIAQAGPDQRPVDQPYALGTPALRTGGLALVHSGRADSLQQQFTRSLDLDDGVEQGTPRALYAEDLTRGLRLDVLDAATGAWRSLHQRRIDATAQRHPTPLDPVADEGFFQPSLAGPPTLPGQQPDAAGELYVHETLATWDGWSLSAPRPGKSLSSDPRAPQEGEPQTQPQRVTNDPLTAMGLSIEAEPVAGTLPRLRFGRAYRLRARTVDLAGNGPTLDEADAFLTSGAAPAAVLPATDAAPYLRFEPVPAPTLVPAQRFDEGASLLRLVIRSAPDQDAAGYADGHPPYRPTDERHVAAPKAALELVEHHGLLDAVIGSDGSAPSQQRVDEIRAAYDIARRESGSFDDPALPTAELVELGGDPADPQRYVIHHEQQLELPYLPDPLAAGVLIFGLPGRRPDDPLAIAFDADPWYEPQPLRLRLSDDPAGVTWNANARVLTVGLPQATTARVRVCSILQDIGPMGIVRWCEDTLAGAELDAFLHAAKDNRCWLLTPWHEVTLVHAVQQPLRVPEWITFDTGRAHGATDLQLSGGLALHPSSTEKIDLVAHWEETVDDLAAAGPETRSCRAVVFELPVRLAPRVTGDPGSPPLPYCLFDDKLLTFSTPLANELRVAVPAAHMFGDTHYRKVSYTAVATTPFREDFPADWAEQHPELLSVTSDTQTVDVLSSAAPAAPRVLYVIPTQGWETRADGHTTTRRRRGGGLRVYLDRPWYSSGDGELLGVVIGDYTANATTPDWPYTTVFSRDPVRAAPAVQSARIESFPGALRSDGRVTLPEAPDLVFGLVSFAPAYDASTRRWFCDIDIDTENSYMPFIRLGLVRHQPNSLDGCALSPVVLTDIVQTLPDRTLTVTRAAADPAQVDIGVSGPAYTAIRGPEGMRSDPAALGRIVARVEERDPAIADDVLGWTPVAGAEVELTAATTGELTTWSGHLAVAPGGQRRLVIVEQDHLTIDADTPGTDHLAGRIVYADTVAL